MRGDADDSHHESVHLFITSKYGSVTTCGAEARNLLLPPTRMASSTKVHDLIVERLSQLGVRHVFGVGGANIEDMFAAVQRRRPEIRAVLCKHEHAAGTAADAYARLRGFGVVMTTSGGGAMNLVHAMAEARASRIPVLAIVGEPPTNLQGKGAFQDTSGKGSAVDALAVFRAVTVYAARVERAADAPQLLEEALEAALGGLQGPSLLLIAKDLQCAEIATSRSAVGRTGAPTARPNQVDLQLASRWLSNRPVVVIAGPEVSRCHAELDLALLATELDATVATAPDARDAFDNRDPRFLGVSGAMGHLAVSEAIQAAQTVLLAGTTLPLLARQGLESVLSEKAIVSVGLERPFVSFPRCVHVDGDLSTSLRTLATLATDSPRTSPASVRFDAAQGPPIRPPSFTMASLLDALDRSAPAGSVILVDAGNTGASAVHHVRSPRGGRWLLAMGMAGMGYTFGAATGAAFATGKRCIVIAGDGAFFMQGMEIHTAVEHGLPITYVILDNRAHGMCLVRERLLLGENAGYNAFRSSRLGAGLAAMFPGLPAHDCETRSEFELLLQRSFRESGPSVVCASMPDVEVPPFSAFRERAPTALTVPREVDDGRVENAR